MSNNKVIKSSMWYLICNFLVSGINFLSTPIFARIMSNAEYGLYNNYVSWMSIFQIICSLMLQSSLLTAQYDYKGEVDNYIASLLSLSFIFTSGIFIIVLFNVDTFSSITNIPTDYIVISFFFLLVYPATGFYQIKQRMEYKYKKSVLVSIVTVVFTVGGALLWMGLSNDKLFGRIYGSRFLVIALNFCLLVYFACKANKISFRYWGYALKISIPFIFHSLGMTILSSSDRIMITNFCGEEKTSLYSLAYSCSAIISTFTSAILAAIDPWLVEKINQKDYKSTLNLSGKLTAGMLFLSTGCMLIAPEILLVMGGSKYVEAIQVMPPVLMGTFFQYLYTFYGSIEQFSKRTKGMAIATGIAAGTNIILNWVFIQVFGYIAAAYTTVACYFMLYVIHLIIVKIIKKDNYLNNRINALSAIAGMIITILVSALYKYTYIRIIFIILYGLGFFLFTYTNRKTMKKIIKSFIRRDNKNENSSNDTYQT